MSSSTEKAGDLKKEAAKVSGGIRGAAMWALGLLWTGVKGLFLFACSPVIAIYRAIRWMWVGGWHRVWNEFGSFIVGHVKVDQETKEVLYLRGVHYPDVIHFQALTWGGYSLAAVELGINGIWGTGIGNEAIALLYVCLLVYSLIAVFGNIPFKSAMRLLVLVFVVLPLTDLGVSYAPVLVDPYFPYLGFMSRGFLRPIWDGITWLDCSMSPGMLVLLSTCWSLFLARVAIFAWLDHRIELDKHDLILYQFGESETRDPIYFRGCKLHIRDVSEYLFSFADLAVTSQTSRQERRFRNIFAWGWRWTAFNQLVNTQSRNERLEAARQGDLDAVGIKSAEEERDTEGDADAHGATRHDNEAEGHHEHQHDAPHAEGDAEALMEQ